MTHAFTKMKRKHEVAIYEDKHARGRSKRKGYMIATIFILHSRESKLNRYVLDGMSALAWDLPFTRRLGHLSSS